MSDTIEAYCFECRQPIRKSEIISGFVREMKTGKQSSDGKYIHVFHDREAQDLLNDKVYMDAVGDFLIENAKLGEEGIAGTDISKQLAMSIAVNKNLNFESFELALRAFYSFAIYQQNLEASDGDTAKEASESGDSERSADGDPHDGIDGPNNGEDETAESETKSGSENPSGDV